MRNVVDKVRDGIGGFFKRVFGSFTVPMLIVTVAVLISLLAGLFYLSWQRSIANQLTELWEKADQPFRTRNYKAAEKKYEAVLSFLNDHQHREPAHYVLATYQVRLSRLCGATETAAGNEPPESSSDPFLKSISELRTAIEEMIGDEVLKSPADAMEADDASGPGLSPKKREELILGFLADDQNSVLRTLKTAYEESPSERILERMERIASLIGNRKKELEALEAYLEGRRRELDLQKLLTEFQELSEAAEKSLTKDDLETARLKWESIIDTYRPESYEILWHDYLDEDGKPQQWEDHISRVRSASISVTNGRKEPTDLKLPGQLLADGPPVLPIHNYAALVQTSIQNARTEAGFLFVRVDDFCWALSEKGNPVRVWKTGYDLQILPQMLNGESDRHVAMLWDDKGIQCLSILDSALEPVWTWRLTSELSFSGAPRLIHGRVAIALQDGRLWLLELTSGQPDFHCTLPGNLTSGLVETEDERAGLITGEDLTTYFVEFPRDAPPRLKNVAYPQSGTNSVSSSCIWLPPFAILFENDIDGTCQMIVIREDDSRTDDQGRFQEVDRVRLDGHVLQPPAIRGAQLLVATDAGRVHVFGLTVRNQKPVYEISSRSLNTGRVETPFFTSHPKAGFFVATGGTLHTYFIDTLASAKRAMARKWSTEKELRRASPIQPLQVTDSQIVAAFRSSDLSTIQVVGHDLFSGELSWSSKLASTVSAWQIRAASAGKTPKVTAVSSSGEVFQIALTPEGLRGSHSGYVDTVSPTLTADGFFVCWATDDDPKLEYFTIHGYRTQSVPLTSRATTSVALRDVQPPDSEGTNEEPADEATLQGTMAAFIDAERSLQVASLTHPDVSVVAPPLVDVPDDGWFTPVWKNDRSLIAAHPSGVLVHLQISDVSGVLFLAETARRRFASGLQYPPLVHESAIIVSNENNTTAVLDPESLEEKTRIATPGLSAAPIVASDSVFLGDERGELLRLDISSVTAGEDKPQTERYEVSQHALEYVVAPKSPTQLIATDVSGAVFAVNVVNGTKRLISRCGRPVLTPLPVGNSVMIALSDGSISLATYAPQQGGTEDE